MLRVTYVQLRKCYTEITKRLVKNYTNTLLRVDIKLQEKDGDER